MHVIRFANPTAPTKMESGQVVNGLKTKLWVERYRQPGEFKFTADASSVIRNLLPVGSFVSHMDTLELMVVENHEVTAGRDRNPEIAISGRSFETLLEQRQVGSNKVFPTSNGSSDYDLPLGALWDQAAFIIKEHILAANLIDDNNALPYVDVATTFGAGGGIERSVKKDTVHKALMDLLAISDYGIKNIRPGDWGIPFSSVTNTTMLIHSGAGKKGRVAFSSDTGAIETSEYLWTNKDSKNAALVRGRWVELFVVTGPTELARRVMLVDGNDIDNSFQDPPIGDDLAAVITAMTQRGNSALQIKNDVALSKIEFSANAKDAIYRKDFEVGDIITILDDYNETSAQRITEYAEIEDEQGTSGHPTLELLP